MLFPNPQVVSQLGWFAIEAELLGHRAGPLAVLFSFAEVRLQPELPVDVQAVADAAVKKAFVDSSSEPTFSHRSM